MLPAALVPAGPMLNKATPVLPYASMPPWCRLLTSVTTLLARPSKALRLLPSTCSRKLKSPESLPLVSDVSGEGEP